MKKKDLHAKRLYALKTIYDNIRRYGWEQIISEEQEAHPENIPSDAHFLRIQDGKVSVKFWDTFLDIHEAEVIRDDDFTLYALDLFFNYEYMLEEWHDDEMSWNTEDLSSYVLLRNMLPDTIDNNPYIAGSVLHDGTIGIQISLEYQAFLEFYRRVYRWKYSTTSGVAQFAEENWLSFLQKVHFDKSCMMRKMHVSFVNCKFSGRREMSFSLAFEKKGKYQNKN